MKAQSFFLILIILMSFLNSKAQIAVTCDGKVGLGAGNTSPGNAVDILGITAIRPMSSGAYLRISTDGSYGFTMNPSSAHNGQLGYQTPFHTINSDLVYANGVLLTSDSKFKSNIKQLELAMPLIKELRPVTFDYNFDYSKVESDNLRSKLQNEDKNRMGFIAQEVQKILPQAVKVKESDSTLCIRMDDFIPLLVKGMQEQAYRIDSLKSLIDELKASQNMLKSAAITGTNNTLNSTAILYQNSPNPFTEKTTINLFIPENNNDARLLVFDMQGTLVKTYEISGRNQTFVAISGAELRPGMYIYSLVLDNSEIDSKRMILTN